MKVLFQLITIFSFSIVYGQVEILNSSLTNPTIPVAYLYFTNNIVISGFESDTAVIVLSGKDTLEKSDGHFIYYGTANLQDTLTAFKNRIIVATKIYSIEKLKPFRIFLGDLRDTLVTKTEILANLRLIVSYEPQIAIPCTYVIEFDGEIVRKNGRRTPLATQKNKPIKDLEKWEKKMERKSKKHFDDPHIFTLDRIRQIQRMKSGDTLHIQHCILACPSCIKRSLTIDLRFTIK